MTQHYHGAADKMLNTSELVHRDSDTVLDVRYPAISSNQVKRSKLAIKLMTDDKG